MTNSLTERTIGIRIDMEMRNESSYKALRFGPDPSPDLPTNQLIPHSAPELTQTQEKETRLNCIRHVLPIPSALENFSVE